MLHTPSSGVWLFKGALRGEQLLAALVSTLDWVVRGTYRTAWAVEPRCLCSYAYGRRVAVGPQTGARSWELLRDLWRAIAPQMAPWCAVGDVPTCANLNYYGGSGSCVRWNSDDEVQIGGRGESKLIVSVSVGFSALFRWKPRPSPNCEADSTWLHHGDLLVIDGRCQDEYLHCTDPRLDEERVKITFRWLKNHVPQCPLGAGVACCLPTCVKGLPVPVCVGLDRLVLNSGRVLWFLLGMGLLLLAFLALVGLWQRKSKYFWAKPLCSFQDTFLSFWHARETPGVHAGLGFLVSWVLGVVLGFWGCKGNRGIMPGTLVGVWPPSLSDYDACLVFCSKRAVEGNNGRPKRETSFPFSLPRGRTWVFLVSRTSMKRFWGKVLCLLWIGRDRHPGPVGGGALRLEAFNVGGWLTHGDIALETTSNFLAISEHRLIPARVRSEWAGLRRKGIHSVWAPAFQEGSHVGHAGVGIVSLRGAPVSMPSFATSAFRQFFELGRLVRCVLPLGNGRVMHLVVVYGYQGADDDSEKLSFTDQLFGAALCELAVVTRGHACSLAGDFNVEPTKIPCLLKGIMAGLWFDLQGAWARASGVEPSVTCKKYLASSGGTRRDFILGCPLAAAALGCCGVDPSRWVQPHFAVRTDFQGSRWSAKVKQPCRVTPLWPASRVSAVDKSRSSRSTEVRDIWDIYDHVLQFIPGDEASAIDEALAGGSPHLAWDF